MAKLDFLSRDPSKIILICRFSVQETFLIIINFEKVVLLNIFVETVNFFSGFYNDKKDQKNSI